MIDVISRAEALKALIETSAFDASRASYEEAIVSCSTRLIEIGSPNVAIDLINLWTNRSPEAHRSVRVSTVLARAKLVDQDFSGSLSLIRKTLRDEKEQLSLDR